MLHQNGLLRRNSAVEKRAIPTRTKLNSQNSGDELHESVSAVKTQCPNSGQWRRSCVHVLICIQLFVTSWTVIHQTPLSMEFSRQEYWSGLPFPPPGDLPKPGFKPKSPVSPALQVESLPIEAPGKPHFSYKHHIFIPRIFNKSISQKQVILTN